MAVIGGIVATLLGVLLGAFLTGRSQNRSWVRDRQLEACMAIIRESTKMQLELRQQFKRGGQVPDWAPWNEALALVGLVGHPNLVKLAQRMDHAFWKSGEVVKRGEDRSEQQWEALRNPLEQTRLEFLNAARLAVAARASVVDQLVVRPPLVEFMAAARKAKQS